MADLDEISMMLGEIRSDLKNAAALFSSHEYATRERFVQLATRLDVLASGIHRLEHVETTVKKLEPVVESVTRLKWLAAGFIACLSLAGGVLGSIASQTWKWFS